MSKPSSSPPFADLGKHLRLLREKLSETLVEASGAVEINVGELASFELGKQRPSEEVLMLLISHFKVVDEEAVSLWELAGYGIVGSYLEQTSSNVGQFQPDSVSLGESRIIYTDIIHVMVNPYGVVMNFMQGAGPNTPPVAVARIGMSREHASSVLQVLQATLDQSEKAQPSISPRQLSSPEEGKSD